MRPLQTVQITGTCRWILFLADRFGRLTLESDTLDVLVTLVEAYEVERWPIEAPDPIAAIKHVMEARGLRQKDFAALIGSQPRASEVLNRQRPLTLPMIRVLSIEWNLPADVLVREYDLANVT